MPKISVCLDVFNYARFLPQSVESVLGQTCADFELLIFDDCSTDGSFEIASRYAAQDARVTAHRHAENLGMVRNRNAALRAARGEFVKFLHADDWLCSPRALEQMGAVLDERPSVSLVACGMRCADAEGRDMGVLRHTHPRPLVSGVSVITRCLRARRNLVGTPTSVMFRRDRAARGFDEAFFDAADLEMWFHLLEQGAFAWLDEPLCAYRWHEFQKTSEARHSLGMQRDHAELLDRYLDRPYVDLKPLHKRLLRAEAAREMARRRRKLGEGPSRGSMLQRFAPSALKLARFYEHHVEPRMRPATETGPQGINVIGFLTSEFGVGDAARAFAHGAQCTGLPLALCNIESRTHRNDDATFAEFSATNPYRVNLLATSVDHTRRYCRDHRDECAGHHNIGLWFWELEQLPARWHGGFDWLDEVWTPTEFCRRAFAEVSPVPVRKISYPLLVEPAAPDRARLELPPDACVFLFTFDFLSSIERKNPLAVIEAFRLAFGGSRDALLMLKTINSDRTPEARSLVADALHGLNVRWSEPHITGAEMRALTASCDCYVSLHRSEGLGLGMAQAMALGKPVIATNWSGNLEFMDTANSLLVGYSFVEIAQDVGKYYERGNHWADADIEDAAAKMRRVFENRDEARQLGVRAAADIAERLNPERTAREIVARLTELELVE